MPGSIGISPLSTSHPMVLHGQPVRASIAISSYFTLLMVSSPRFGSYACYFSCSYFWTYISVVCYSYIRRDRSVYINCQEEINMLCYGSLLIGFLLGCLFLCGLCVVLSILSILHFRSVSGEHGIHLRLWR